MPLVFCAVGPVVKLAASGDQRGLRRLANATPTPPNKSNKLGNFEEPVVAIRQLQPPESFPSRATPGPPRPLVPPTPVAAVADAASCGNMGFESVPMEMLPPEPVLAVLTGSLQVPLVHVPPPGHTTPSQRSTH
jgi:hypothetical protein